MQLNHKHTEQLLLIPAEGYRNIWIATWGAGIMAKNKEIVALTGLRGVAACTIALYHFAGQNGGRLGWYFHKGYLSVDIFFVLSGFVMATTYRHFFEKHVSLGDYRRFLYLRIARIWPLYLVAVVVAIGSYNAFKTSLEVVLANVLMIQGWGIARSINIPLWSVSTEFVAYLAFPFLFLFASRSQRFNLPLLIGASLVLIGACAYINIHDPERDLVIHALYGTHQNGVLDLYAPYSVLPIMRCLAGFALGVVVWHLSRRSPSIRQVASSNSVGIACATIILALVALNANDLIIYPFFPVLVLSLSQDKGILASLFKFRPVRFLGVISFAMYALQLPYFIKIKPLLFKLAEAVPPGLANLVFYGGAAAGLLIISIVAHYLIEKPGRMALRMQIRERTQPVAA